MDGWIVSRVRAVVSGGCYFPSSEYNHNKSNFPTSRFCVLIKKKMLVVIETIVVQRTAL